MRVKYLLIALYSIIVTLLLVSVIHSGYAYQFDPDELFHINIPFLLYNGLAPYRDFFFTYTPVFHWFLWPLSWFTGFTISNLFAARGAMIALFMLRALLIFLFVRKLFGKRTAYLFVPLYLFDPFTVYSGMQVRPDNLMMTIYIAGLYALFIWYMDKKRFALTIAGFCFGLSMLTLLKNLPATGIIVLFTVMQLRGNHTRSSLGIFLGAAILPALVVAVWAISRGLFAPMVQQLVFDAKHLNDILRYPENILNYYWPKNFALYGFEGKTLTWVYELLLPLLAFGGIVGTVFDIHEKGPKRRFILWFLAAGTVQWVSLLFVRSVFLQYFLSVSWFLVVCEALLLTQVYKTFCVSVVSKQVATAAAFLLLLVGFFVSWNANAVRATLSSDAQIAGIERQWRLIPESALVFHGTLFRRSVYPLAYQSNFVDLYPYISRYGSPSECLSRQRVPFVVLDPYNYSFLDVATKKYIETNYVQNPQDSSIWVLK